MSEVNKEHKLPKYAFLDADPVCYAGAASAEKKAYQFVIIDGGNVVEKSEVFRDAKEAKEWLETQSMFGGDEGWERITVVVDRGLQAAYDATDEVVKDYLKTFRKFSCHDDSISLEEIAKYCTGYLTMSGTLKTKDIKGLEDKYQFNRDPDSRPKYLAECRKYLQDNHPWVKMSAKGFEADTHCIAKAEEKGEDGVIMSIDKDLDQAEETWYINMNPTFSNRKMHYATSLGELWVETNPAGKEKIKGNGFKWLCFQAGVGDASDGYKGLNGFGEKAAYKLLDTLKSKEECMEAMIGVYLKKLTKGYLSKEAKELGAKPIPNHILYVSWDGKRKKLDALGLMQQHFFLAYQERSLTDVFEVRNYLLTGVSE